MKIKSLFLPLWLFGLILCSTTSFAQITIKSGSLQVNALTRGTLSVELKGPQVFEETFSGSIIFSNLLPGEYLLTLKSPQRRGRSTPVTQQTVCIDQEQRLSCNIDERGHFTSRTTIDKNSILLVIPGRGHNDRLNPHDVYGRQAMPEAISQADLNKLMSTLAKASFDSEKEQILNVSAEYSFYYTNQVKQLLSSFSSDNKRLEWAKRLTPRVLDQHNLYTLGEAFTFDGTKRAYYEFLKTAQPSSR